jgi:hypothetical protein
VGREAQGFAAELTIQSQRAALDNPSPSAIQAGEIDQSAQSDLPPDRAFETLIMIRSKSMNRINQIRSAYPSGKSPYTFRVRLPRRKRGR